MHILIGLIGLTIATVIIMLWARGTLFACVFLSIPTTLVMLIFAFQDRTGSPNGPVWALVCAMLLAVIWAPRCFRLARADNQGS
jgi:RsiW-degrading membrane proteinase PrsW (M82 family)